MSPLRDWLFKTVAHELSLMGIVGINLKQLANSAGMSYKQLCELFPDKRSLVLAVIEEISEAHKDFVLELYPIPSTPRDRLIQFILRSIVFCDTNPSLAQVIIIALLGSDLVVKEHVFQVYERLFPPIILDDLISEAIIPNRSLLLISDLTRSLLSLMFLEGCPWLQMEYISYVYPDKIAISALDAMKKRYAMDEFSIPAA